MLRPRCVYCGKPLPAALLLEAEKTAAEAVHAEDEQRPASGAAQPASPPAADRVLVILDLRRCEPRALARALGLSAFEAGQRSKRGGFQLHRVAARAEALADAERIAREGVATLTLAEAEALAEPVVVRAGRLEPGGLQGRSGQGRFDWPRTDLLLVVKGPIRRQNQAEDKHLKRMRTASPNEGYRFHLHRRSDRRPLELDPEAFDFEAERGVLASSFLRMSTWLDSFEPRPDVDDGFRFLTPALGAAEAQSDVARSLGRAGERKDAAVVLDNVRQFRFYSGWRGALARALGTAS
jgi:hypothetical protein